MWVTLNLKNVCFVSVCSDLQSYDLEEERTFCHRFQQWSTELIIHELCVTDTAAALHAELSDEQPNQRPDDNNSACCCQKQHAPVFHSIFPSRSPSRFNNLWSKVTHLYSCVSGFYQPFKSGVTPWKDSGMLQLQAFGFTWKPASIEAKAFQQRIKKEEVTASVPFSRVTLL